MKKNSIWGAGFRIAGVLVMLGAGAAAQSIERGGQLKCANNLASDISASATLTWTAGGVPVSDPPQAFACDAGANPQDNQVVLQPASADGWSVVITIQGLFGTLVCDPDVGSFTAGGVPHIRAKCGSPTGGTVTFTLQRKA